MSGLATGLPHYMEAGSLPCALRLRFAFSDSSLRNQLSARMECLIQGLGLWNGAVVTYLLKDCS